MHRFPSILHRSGLATHFSETLIWRHPFKRRLATTTILLLFLLVLVAAFIASLWLDTVSIKLFKVSFERIAIFFA